MRIADHIYDILKELTPNADREGLKETPQRAEKYLQEIMCATRITPAHIKSLLKTFEDGSEGYDAMVFEGGIPFYSLCEHHMAPFFGAIHIGYIPKGKIVGLSKLPRLVELLSASLQVQERLTVQIASAINDFLEPEGVGVVIRGRHLCMESRGVRRVGVITETATLKGSFKDDPTVRAEFYEFVKGAGRGAL